MSKSIKSSHYRLAALNNPLGIRQPGGAMPKRQAQGVELAAIRLLHKSFKVGGIVGEYARRGFENVLDTGIEKTRLYCENCGAMMKDESETNCRICKIDIRAINGFKSELFLNKSTNKVDCRYIETKLRPLSTDKFSLTCKSCDLPFYLKNSLKVNQSVTFSEVKISKDKRKSDVKIYRAGFSEKFNHSFTTDKIKVVKFESLYKKENELTEDDFTFIYNRIETDKTDTLDNRKLDFELGLIVCKCFEDRRKEYAANLRRDRKARKFFLENQAKNKLKTIEPRKMSEKEVAQIKLKELLLTDTSTFSRKEKQALFNEKSRLAKIANS